MALLVKIGGSVLADSLKLKGVINTLNKTSEEIITIVVGTGDVPQIETLLQMEYFKDYYFVPFNIRFFTSLNIQENNEKLLHFLLNNFEMNNFELNTIFFKNSIINIRAFLNKFDLKIYGSDCRALIVAKKSNIKNVILLKSFPTANITNHITYYNLLKLYLYYWIKKKMNYKRLF